MKKLMLMVLGLLAMSASAETIQYCLIEPAVAYTQWTYRNDYYMFWDNGDQSPLKMVRPDDNDVYIILSGCNSSVNGLVHNFIAIPGGRGKVYLTIDWSGHSNPWGGVVNTMDFGDLKKFNITKRHDKGGTKASAMCFAPGDGSGTWVIW